jgi:phosphoenolpyruvate carboxykinase (ATP)
MNNFLEINTPAEAQSQVLKSDFDLDALGLSNLRKVYWNLPTEALYEESLFRNEGKLTRQGPLVVNTGKHTARAANDKAIVREPSSEDKVWWGQYNKPMSQGAFDGLYNRLLGYLQGRDVFIQDCFAGADPDYRLPLRIITENAWHSMFARNMFIKPQSQEEYQQHVPGFTVICAPGFKASPQIDQTRSETFIILNLSKKICIIGNTGYAGEIKKAVFTVMNYLLPLQGVMTMHCSANKGAQGDVALFFGLSGTGKTTLSADPLRQLIGDDEHGWSAQGVFNFEDGCYAKVIRLSPKMEPEIYACTRKFGAILENVGFDPLTREIDLDDDHLTENTRASYPLAFIDNSVPEKLGGHPKNIVLLTCDACGVMPPIARLDPDQALYHFISGYTSKVAGTEVGLKKEPEITFSTCFGAPFMVHHPSFYAELLKNKILEHQARCWLVNTGWVGGAFGVGKRIRVDYTRTLLNAALSGALDESEYYTDPFFGFKVPTQCSGIPDILLHPAKSWPSEAEYEKKYEELVVRFNNNFKQFEEMVSPEVLASGPHLKK